MSSAPGPAADRPTERPTHDIEDLFRVRVRLAVLGRGPDAASHVVLQHEDGQRIDRRAERSSPPTVAALPRAAS